MEIGSLFRKMGYTELFNDALNGDPYSIKIVIFGLIYIVFAFDFFFDFRQLLRLHEKKMPKLVKEIVSQDEFEKARVYALDKANFGVIASLYNLVETTAMLYFNVPAYFWRIVEEFLINYGYSYAQSPVKFEIYSSLGFLTLLTLLSTVTSLPFSLYSTFVIEERHGFNKQTFGLFVTDTIKGLFVGALFGFPIISGIIYIILKTGANFYFYLWLFILVVQLLMVAIYPTLIQPLFNKFTPLEDGTLRSKINALASKIKYPLTKIFVIDGSKRSSHSNAYLYGFFKNKRIVIYDTLLKQCTEDEICAVIGHELGHWKCSHVLKMLVIGQIHIFALFYTFSLVVHYQPLYTAFGFTNISVAIPVIVGFIFFQYIISPIDSILQFLQNWVSRTFEYQADAFAIKLGYAKLLRGALIKLQIENKSNMNPDPWYSARHYSHPPMVERIAAIDNAVKKKK